MAEKMPAHAFYVKGVRKMEFNKNVSNPMLVGAIELMKAEPSQEHQNMLIAEMRKAKYLAPVVLTPEPDKDENGKITVAPGSKIQFPMLSAPDGKLFFMAFTDKPEYEKWNDAEGKNVCVLNFEELAAMLLRKDAQGNTCPALGFVINPFSANIVIPKEMAAGIMAAEMAQKGQNIPPVTES